GGRSDRALLVLFTRHPRADPDPAPRRRPLRRRAHRRLLPQRHQRPGRHGITVGCFSNPGLVPPVYCPVRAVTRGEMASFLQRGLGAVGRSTWVLRSTLTTLDGEEAVASTTVKVFGALPSGGAGLTPAGAPPAR